MTGPTYKTLRPEDVRFIVVHCSATRPSMDIGVPEIRRWHLERRFLDIGYHMVIRRNGRLEVGRDITIPGAHEPRVNACSVAVCLVGGVTEHDVTKAENNFTPEQFASLRALVRDWKKKFPNAEVIGHRDAPGKTPVAKDCPSFDVRAFFRQCPVD